MSKVFLLGQGFAYSNSLFLLIVGILSLCSSFSYGHEMRPALLKITELSNNEWQLVFKQPQVDGRFLNLQAVTNCRSGDVTAAVNDSALQESFTLYCDQERLNTIRINRLDRTLIDVLVTVINPDESVDNHIISANQPILDLSKGAATVPTYLLLGVEHLLFGLDHVLFVLVLLYLVVGVRNLVKVVTSFTVAHSITLGLSAFDLISIPQAPVEALVALSILLPARAALLIKLDSNVASSHRTKNAIGENVWLLTFIFGLLHGLGFAGAIAEIGLPEDSAMSALFLFNVGLELGQLSVIATALVSVEVLRRVGLHFSPQQVKLPLYLIGGLGIFWFVERTLQVF